MSEMPVSVAISFESNLYTMGVRRLDDIYQQEGFRSDASTANQQRTGWLACHDVDIELTQERDAQQLFITVHRNQVLAHKTLWLKAKYYEPEIYRVFPHNLVEVMKPTTKLTKIGSHSGADRYSSHEYTTLMPSKRRAQKIVRNLAELIANGFTDKPQ